MSPSIHHSASDIVPLFGPSWTGLDQSLPPSLSPDQSWGDSRAARAALPAGRCLDLRHRASASELRGRGWSVVCPSCRLALLSVVTCRTTVLVTRGRSPEMCPLQGEPGGGSRGDREGTAAARACGARTNRRLHRS